MLIRVSVCGRVGGWVAVVCYAVVCVLVRLLKGIPRKLVIISTHVRSLSLSLSLSPRPPPSCSLTFIISVCVSLYASPPLSFLPLSHIPSLPWFPSPSPPNSRARASQQS